MPGMQSTALQLAAAVKLASWQCFTPLQKLAVFHPTAEL